jgi:hypothetical protein
VVVIVPTEVAFQPTIPIHHEIVVRVVVGASIIVVDTSAVGMVVANHEIVLDLVVLFDTLPVKFLVVVNSLPRCSEKLKSCE